MTTRVSLTPELIAERGARYPEMREALREIGGLGSFRESSIPRRTALPVRRV